MIRVMPHRTAGLIAIAAAAMLSLSACGGSSGSQAAPAPAEAGASTGPPVTVSQAETSYQAISGTKPGVSPFVSFVYVLCTGYQQLLGIEFKIAP